VRPQLTPTNIYGLIGYPVKHSLSPAMHNVAFRSLNINAEYRLFEVPPVRLKEFLLDPNAKFEDIDGNSISAGDVLGFNITIPHKVRTSEILLGEAGVGLIKNITVREGHYVFLSGAINTIKRESTKVNYYNTDAPGFMESLKKDLRFNTERKNIIIFGCGGAGRAVVAGLTWKDTKIKKIYIYDTSKEAIDSTKEHFDRFDFVKDKLEYVQEKERISEVIKKCQLLVNASPVGMKEELGPIIDKRSLHKDLSVYDVVYNRETQLIKDTKSLGLPAVNGLGMLLYQGAEAFELWTKKKAPVEVMRNALMEATNK